MLPSGRSREADGQQAQRLNVRLAHYLRRTQQLELENARLVAQTERLRRERPEPLAKAQVRELRRAAERASSEKSRALMERESLRRELEALRSLCGRRSPSQSPSPSPSWSWGRSWSRASDGELRAREKELRAARSDNALLQRRLLELRAEYESLEEAHRRQMGQLGRRLDSQVNSGAVLVYSGPQAASLEEVQEYARGMSQGWMRTLQSYQRKVEEMERAIQEDRAMLSELQKEKMLHASELDKLRTDAEKQGRLQTRLEEQLLRTREEFSRDEDEYRMIIGRLEEERDAMAEAVARRTQEHQRLLRVKMDLGVEVAAYRALLEGERVGLEDAHRRVGQHRRERIIGIKMPGQTFAPRTPTATRHRLDVEFTPSTSMTRRSPVAPSGSKSPSRVIPISLASRTRHQSPASRRDMISFSKARAATSSGIPKGSEIIRGERQSLTSTGKIENIERLSKVENQTSSVTPSPEAAFGLGPSAPRGGRTAKAEMERGMDEADEANKGNRLESEYKDESATESESGERTALDKVSVEEIIENVIKPAGSEAKVCSSGDSKITYHVEKSQQEDGSMKTQIVLQSKVEEEVDVSQESALDQLLSQGLKKVSLEDIEDTETGSMIRNLLSGLQEQGSLQNKSVNVEIIEQPVESYRDEVHEKTGPGFYEPSTYFQIEELEKDQDAQVEKSGDDAVDRSKVGSVQTRKENEESLYFAHDRDSAEYTVSTPDDNLSEPEEGCGITSYGRYGAVDDLSDERYYQDDALPQSGTILEEEDEYRFISDRRSFTESIPECIIEEEVRVSPVVQESMLEFLREDSLEPKEQLRGALEKLQGSVSGPLREELAFLTKVSGENPDIVAVDIKKVKRSSGSGTTTIVAELNLSQTLEDSGLLDDNDDISEERILAALGSSSIGSASPGGSGDGYSVRMAKERHLEPADDFDSAREREPSSLVADEASEASLSVRAEGRGSPADSSSKQE